MHDPSGVYRCLSAVINGKPLDATICSQLKLTLDGELYRTSKGSQTIFEGRFSVNHETFPWRIDITAIDGPFAGQTAQGLIQFDGAILTLCHTMPGQPRPSDLISHEGSGAQLVVWERVESEGT